VEVLFVKNSEIERSKLAARIGQKVRALRKQRGLSLEELALKCEMNAAFLGHVERGMRCPTIYTIEKISVGLGVSLAELFAEDSMQEKNTAELQHLSDILGQLTPEQAKGVVRLVDTAVELIQEKQR
jgi:transcriptional regulator with XRE-family HTH domain